MYGPDILKIRVYLLLSRLNNLLRGVVRGQDGIINEGFFPFCRARTVDRNLVDRF